MILEALGLSKGELELTLDASVYRPGELIKGQVKLNLTEATAARRLVVGLSARQRAVGVAPGQQGLALSYRNDKVYDFHLQLEGSRSYQPGETRRFELLVPRGANHTAFSRPEGLLGDVAQALSFLSNVKRFPVEWRVYAFLERPWQLNPKGEVMIQLAEAAPPGATPPARPARAETEGTEPEGAPLAPPPPRQRATRKRPAAKKKQQPAAKKKKKTPGARKPKKKKKE